MSINQFGSALIIFIHLYNCVIDILAFFRIYFVRNRFIFLSLCILYIVIQLRKKS